MIETEATWIRERLEAFKPRRILNVGSSTLDFRTNAQPFYGAMLEGFDVVHLDKKDAPGVDHVFDIEQHGQTWYQEPFDLVLMTSLLEHVKSRHTVMLNVLPAIGKHLIVSVPYRWPKHNDPIDTGYRPDVWELTAAMEFFGLNALEVASLDDTVGVISIGLFEKMP